MKCDYYEFFNAKNAGMSGAIHIGTSGWNYKHWVGRFYPKDLPQKEWLAFYAEHFDTVEVNNTFYQLPQISTFMTWRETVPSDFTFAIKASRFITHMKKLTAPKTSTEKFFNRTEKLEDKLGPILFQLPPRWQRNRDRLAEFLAAIPPGGRYAFEFRDQSWLESETYALLREHNVAFCIDDFRGKQSPREITADFAYLRMHGPGEIAYAGSYPTIALKQWADQIKDWKENLKATYVYFNNDFQGYAVKNALKLRELV
ncbi:MAG TPA: DUF72 domain-containing protein [Pyrinomonadaceae bacterium]|nr:DUF72 domain-containing protein [Pyrinomonadaceae bacterium]